MTKRKTIGIIAGCVVAVAAIGAAVAAAVLGPSIQEKRIQDSRQETLLQKLEKQNSYVETVNSLEAGTVNKELFERLRTLALDNADTETAIDTTSDDENGDAVTETTGTVDLEQYVGEYISDDDYKIILSADTSSSNTDSPYLWVLENAQDIDESYLKLVADDPEAIDFVRQYYTWENFLAAPETLTESLTEVPALNQWDLRWGYQLYADRRFGLVGNLPTAVSMVVSYLNQDAYATPWAIASFAIEQEDTEIPGITKQDLFTDVANQYGLQLDDYYIEENENLEELKNQITDELNEGRILIVHENADNALGDEENYIVIRGITDDLLVVNDPYSKTNSSRLWSMEQVFNSADHVWSYYNPNFQMLEETEEVVE